MWGHDRGSHQARGHPSINGSDTDDPRGNHLDHNLGVRRGQANVPLPVIVVGTSLPSLPAQLADATSYAAGLYAYRSIGLS